MIKGMRSRLRLFLFAALAIIIVWIFLTLIPRLRYILPPSTSDNSVISRQPCALPCWQNLTIGESTKQDVVLFINSEKLVPMWSVREEENNLRWFWSRNHQGTFYFDNNDVLVKANITPNFEFPLQEFFDIYGFPNALSARLNYGGGNTFYLEAVFLYYEMGVVIYAYSEVDPKNTIVLDPSMKGYRLVLFSRANSLREFISTVYELQGAELDEFINREITVGWPGWNTIVTTKPNESLFLDPLIATTLTQSE